MMANGRVVWITGAGSGFGSALAERFSMNGDVVVLSGRSAGSLNVVAQKIRSNKGTCEVIPIDVQKVASVRKAANKVLRAYNRIDVLVNNAGITAFKSFEATSEREFSKIVSTNLTGMFLVTKSVLRAMLKERQGIILNVLSYAAKTTYTGSAAYSASKTGGAAMMNVLREETRGKGVQVINIYPGAIDTPMWNDRARRKFKKEMMTPWEISALIYEATVQKPNVVVEELVIRPQSGDLHL
jgi:NADP-dependent 3-hydroxy acid dehydrogenase YdfG